LRAKTITKFSPSDIIILGYYLVVAVFIVAAGVSCRLENWWRYFLHHLLVLTILPIFIIKFGALKRNLLSFLRLFYPILLFGSMYRETHDLDQVIFVRPLDFYFAEWDRILFGCQPYIDFATRFSSAWFSEIMHAGYFSYFIIIVLLPLVWWFRRRPDMVQRRVFDLSFTFTVFYFIFILLPVQGPRVQIPEAASIPRNGYLFAPFFRWLFRTARIFGAAFPSSHCGVSALVMANSIKDIPKGAKFVAIMSFAIFLSTVYGRFHYAVDVIYGAGLGLICYILAPYVYRRFKGKGFSGPAGTLRAKSL